jgi:starch synthase
MVASEAVPYAKTGGLADVIGALPRALAGLGHEVDVVIPRYRGVDVGRPERTITVATGNLVSDARCYVETVAGVRTIFIDHPGYFDRDHLYGANAHDYVDNPERFAFLCQAALNWAAESSAPYDIVHGHDWQAGLVPVLQGRASTPSSRRRPATVLTIHNLAYQGVFDASWLPYLGLGWELMHVEAMEYWGRISYLKAGIVFSQLITTVSPRYAEEIQTPELGFGFDGILRQRKADLIGILNGIDYDQWDPERDPNIPGRYSADDLAGKEASKRALLDHFRLPAGEEAATRPVVGLISRMVDQKGFDLLADIADELPRLGAAFVLLGSGERRYEDLWLALAARYPDRIAVHIGFDERLAHLIEAGADLFLMPSRFEPCGLNQMYSLRYGTPPIVHATGGLADTVENFDQVTGSGTGFTFDEYSPQALLGTLRWALGVFMDQRNWRRIQRAGMLRDYSWAASARRYVEVYERAIAPRVGSVSGTWQRRM